MKYEIIESDIFNKWLKSLDNQTINRVLARLSRIANGNFGDYKQLKDDVFELRLFFGYSLLINIGFIKLLKITK
jgi:putative addiction module killer protein